MKSASIFSEIKKQLTNTPSFSLKVPQIESSHTEHLEQLNQQIEEALKNPDQPLIFLIGPFGCGKTTLIHYFRQKHPKMRALYKSFVKINTLDLAFLHLTSFFSRFCLIFLISLISLFIMKMFPISAALPFAVIIAYFFVKNANNLIYILHETLDNLFVGKHRLVILEDLERSSLSLSDQWALLANLWQHKRTYLISLGYSPDDKKAKLQMIEYAQKLGGTIIEVTPYKELNFYLVKKMDPNFPFVIDQKESSEKGAWISLFTLREMLMIKEQAALRSVPNETPENKKRHYIHVCLEFLLAKLQLTDKHIMYDDTTRTLQHFSLKDLSPEQAYFLSSFKESLNN